jgi:hypothetical protein
MDTGNVVVKIMVLLLLLLVCRFFKGTSKTRERLGVSRVAALDSYPALLQLSTQIGG